MNCLFRFIGKPFYPLLLILLIDTIAFSPMAQLYVIHVIDHETERGVPMVELRTVNNIRRFTDSNGLVVIDEPSFMNRRVFFFISSHGYEYHADGFGYRGRGLEVTPGGRETIRLPRLNIAERLYRITGEGIYHDSVIAGETVPIRKPLLNASVLGQDSTQATTYRDQIYWFWGDTDLFHYPLGHFQTAAATSELPSQGGLHPAQGIDLVYVTDEQDRSRRVFDTESGYPIWIEGLCSVEDEMGNWRLITHYTQVESLGNPRAWGIAVWNDETEYFETVVELPDDSPALMHGSQATLVESDNRQWVYFASPYPLLRVPATYEAILDPMRYEAFTCLEAGQRWDADNLPKVARDDSGRVLYEWRANTAWVDRGRQQALVNAGLLDEDEIWLNTRDLETGDSVELHRGSVNWNQYRQKWVMIATRQGGESSYLGDVYFAEADAPQGPWPLAVRIVRHDDYSFYNPVHHPFFDDDDGRLIYFEGTYVNTFSGNENPTPRYDYNQIMYQLDLSDPRLRLNRLND